MTQTIKEETVTFSQYKNNETDSDIRIFICGFEPTYAPVICIKGKENTMGELKEKLEELLDVKVDFSKKNVAF